MFVCVCGNVVEVEGQFETYLDLKKAFISSTLLSVKPPKLRLIHAGKIREDNELIGELDGAKLMAILPPGVMFEHEKPKNSPTIAPNGPDNTTRKESPVLAKLTTLSPGEESSAVVKVTQGKTEYKVDTDLSLTAGPLRRALARYFKTDPDNLRLLSGGKLLIDSESMVSDVEKKKMRDCMLFFGPGYHADHETSLWLAETEKQLPILKDEVIKLEKLARHRGFKAEIQRLNAALSSKL